MRNVTWRGCEPKHNLVGIFIMNCPRTPPCTKRIVIPQTRILPARKHHSLSPIWSCQYIQNTIKESYCCARTLQNPMSPCLQTYTPQAVGG
eukprot:m.70751 g.70751  ORF g.70751 m.70751 type:complete len:91 (+) comp12161_c0_seq5:932-1204(+)